MGRGRGVCVCVHCVCACVLVCVVVGSSHLCEERDGVVWRGCRNEAVIQGY